MTTTKSWLAGAALAAALALPIPDAPAASAGQMSSSNQQSQQRAVELAPRFEQGASVTYDHTMDTTQKRTIEILNDTAETKALLRRRVTLTVIETLDDGGARVRISFDRLRMDVTPPNTPTFSFDSANPPEAEDADALEAMLLRVFKLPVVVQVDRRGEPVEFENPRQLKETIGFQQVARNLGILFSESWFMGVARGAFAVGGDEPRREVGETWSETMTTNVGGIPDRSTYITYELESVENDIAHISGSGDLDIEIGGTIEIEGAETELLDEYLTFEIRWDLEAGHLSSYETSQSIRLVNEKTPIGAPFLMELFTDISMTRVEPGNHDDQAESE